MTSGQTYDYDQADNKRKVDPVNAGYDQPSDPPAYTPTPYGNQQHRQQFLMGQYPQGSTEFHPPLTNTNNVNVVMTQPQVSTVIVNPRPSDYLGWSIVTMLCCCFPIGIAAIIFSCSSRASANNLHFDQARKEVKTSRTLNIVGLALGIAIWIFMASWLSK